jgi:MFS family permease
LLATVGEGVCFLFNAVSYIFVIGSLLMMHVEKRVVKKSTDMMNDLKEGLRYTFGFAPIKHLILLLGLVSLMGTSYQVLMPVFAKEIIQGGSETYGFMMGAAGFGALVGAVFLASRESVIKLGRIIPAAASLFGAGLVALSFSRFFSLSLLLMVFVGTGIMLHTASSNTILQTITDDDKRGRVMSFYTMAIMGTAPFGSLLAGTLAKLIGTPYTIMIGGLCCIAGAFFFYRKLPELKKIVRPGYVKMGIIPEVATGIQIATEPVTDPQGINSSDIKNSQNYTKTGGE